jgi:iron(III) transport system ATP-binding protein
LHFTLNKSILLTSDKSVNQVNLFTVYPSPMTSSPSSSPSSSVILALHQITKQYPAQPFPAVNAVSLTLEQGELLALLGPSGCGKTTLLRLVAGFEVPQAGYITLAGQPICGNGHWVAPERRDVGVVFQDYALFPHLSVLGNVSFGLKHLTHTGQLPKAQIKTLALEAVQLVGLKGYENRYPHELSGGQQQRVALARALAPRPSLILLDEPFSNLDVQVRLYLRQEVRDILKNVGASGIFVTHDQEEALAIADKVAVMRQGAVEQFGTPEEIYRAPASRFIAEFVTQANFVPAHRTESGWETEVGYFEEGTLTIDHETAQATEGDVMIRQEDLHIEVDETAPLLIRDRQFLGREYKYCILTPSARTLHARTPIHQKLPIGARVRASVMDHRLRFFTPSLPPLPSSQSLPTVNNAEPLTV